MMYISLYFLDMAETRNLPSRAPYYEKIIEEFSGLNLVVKFRYSEKATKI